MKRAGLVIGCVLVGIVVIAGATSAVWTPHDPNLVVPAERLMGPNGQHWLGTDGFGSDIASRMFVGARTCLLVGVVSVLIAAGIGVPWGLPRQCCLVHGQQSLVEPQTFFTLSRPCYLPSSWRLPWADRR